jgi:uncharacterized BrkB/YihY/UPF0761 family membrane protein
MTAPMGFRLTAIAPCQGVPIANMAVNYGTGRYDRHGLAAGALTSTGPSGPHAEPPVPGQAADAVRKSTGRARRMRQWATGQVDSGSRRLQEARATSRVVDGAVSAFENETETGGAVLAAALAFRCFVFLVPYTLVLVELAGFIFAGFSSATPPEIAHSAGVTGLIANTLSDATTASLLTRIVTLVSALAITLWTTRSLLKVLFIVHELMWRLPVVAPHVSFRRIGAVFGGFTAFSLVVGVLHRYQAGSVLGFVLYLLAALVVPFAIWMGLSMTLPRPMDAQWSSVVPGAIVVAVGACGLQLATVYWLSWEIERKSTAYGSLGVALAMLAWAYLLGRLLTVSIALNAALWHRNTARLASVPERRSGTPGGPV